MNKTSFRLVVTVVLVLIISALIFGPRLKRDDEAYPEKFGFGRIVKAKEIVQWDIDVRPDGKGLPATQGTVAEGRLIYVQQCASCHAASPAPPLISDTSAGSKPKAIGNYWPYATTLFDYIRRTMPYNAPGSLSDEEVYSVTAFLLNANSIIKEDMVLNKSTLPTVVMPARKLFVKDTRRGGNEVK